MSLYNTYNNEDLISRAVIAGMLNVLNNTIEYNQVWSNEDVEIVKVPWFYNQSGDERFMQDFYTHYHSCNFPKPVDGNFEKIPRGVITYTGADVDANRITNRFVQGKYVREVEGKLQSFVSFLYSIPLTVRFDCEIWADTQVTALKIEQAIREAFYKTVTFYVYYKGMRLGCTSGFSEDISIDKLIEYSFETDNKIKIKFNIEVETYQPVFDPTTEMDANNTIKNLGYSLYTKDDKSDGVFKITTPSSGAIIPKGVPLIVEWDYTDEGAVVRSVDAYWLVSGENEWNLIESGIPNHQMWIWEIPDDFTTYNEPSITWNETDDLTIQSNPKISILPIGDDKEITEESFIITFPGYFNSPKPDSSIGIILEMLDEQGREIYTGDNDIYLNIRNYRINMDDPVWIDPSVNIIFPGKVEPAQINIHIANNINKDAFGVVEKLTIL